MHNAQKHREAAGPASAYLHANVDARLYLPFVVTGELAAGGTASSRPRWHAFLAPFYVLPSTPDVAWEFGRAYRYLEDRAMQIPQNDLWNAATALAYQMPVVTRHADRFRRVPDLEVEDY
jgi:predicted nucleic acid-binding protein